MNREIEKELEWYKAFCDHVELTNYKAYDYACEYANDVTSDVEYPLIEEGDSYWTIEPLDEDNEYEDNTGFYHRGVVAIQSCWDDVSRELHRQDPHKEYFEFLEDVLIKCRDKYDFVQVECFDCDMEDINNGDYLVCPDEESGKFQKSY